MPAPPAFRMLPAAPVDRDEPVLPAIRRKRPRGDPDCGVVDAILDDAEASPVDEAVLEPCAPGGNAADCSSQSTVNVLLHLRMKSVERTDEVHVGGATYTRTSRSVEREVEMEVSSPPPQAASSSSSSQSGSSSSSSSASSSSSSANLSAGSSSLSLTPSGAGALSANRSARSPAPEKPRRSSRAQHPQCDLEP